MSARDRLGLGPARSVTLIVDGDAIEAASGQTIAAALISHGHPSWRRTRFANQPRGLFCGVGACQDCLVTVSGVASVRACLAEVRDGDVIETAT